MKIATAPAATTKKAPVFKPTNRFPKAVKNILTIYGQATQEELAGGLAWYNEANEFATEQASIYGLRVEVVAGIISALSPATDWERNKADALQVLAGNKAHKFGTYGNNVNKAFHILAEANADVVERYFPADKTFNFFHNIINPAGKKHVTIDRHALSVALGEVREDKTVSKVEYRELASAYTKAAKKLGVTPLQVQAVSWLVWRASKGYKSKYTLDDLLSKRNSIAFN